MRAKRQGKGDKRQSSGSKAGRGKARGQPGGRPEGRPEAEPEAEPEAKPGILKFWEGFSETSLQNWFDDMIEQVGEELDEQAQSFRSLN